MWKRLGHEYLRVVKKYLFKLFAKGAFLKCLVQKMENERRFAKMGSEMVVYFTCKHVEIALKIVSQWTLLVFSKFFGLS